MCLAITLNPCYKPFLIKVMNKEIWSSRYGKNKTEGLQKWLSKNVKNYKRQDLQKYINGLSIYLGRSTKSDTPKLASDNFAKWTQFVLNGL